MTPLALRLPIASTTGLPSSNSSTRSVRSVLEADAKKFTDPHLQKSVESHRTNFLDEFRDTVFNSDGNHWEDIKANDDKRGPDGWVKLELNEGSKPVVFSPIRAVGLQEGALNEKVQRFEERGLIEGSKSLWVACRILVPKLWVKKWRLVIDYRYLNSCLE